MVKRKFTKEPDSGGAKVQNFKAQQLVTALSFIPSSQVEPVDFKPKANISGGAQESHQLLHDNPRRSPSGTLGAFRRTQSQGQKENRRIAPTDLASPFKEVSSRAPTSVFSQNLSSSSKASKLFRRPSADNPSTHISTKPISFHRRPSGSHALQRKLKDYDSWIVPFLPLASWPVQNTKDKSPLVFNDLDIVNSPLRFSPQLCSTPVRKIRIPDALPANEKTTLNDVLMKDDVAVQTDPADLVLPDPALLSTNVFGPNIAQSAELKQNESVCCDGKLLADAPPPLIPSSSSPTNLDRNGSEKQLSSEPDSLNLRKMFSGLDIAGTHFCDEMRSIYLASCSSQGIPHLPLKSRRSSTTQPLLSNPKSRSPW